MHIASRKFGFVLARSAVALAAFTAAGLAIHHRTDAGGERAGAEPRRGAGLLATSGVQSEPRKDPIEAGRQAMARGDREGAIAAYRRAWRSPEHRGDAAEALSELARTPGASVRADEAAVAKVQKLLGSTFARYETPHFVILSDCTPDWTNARGAMLEQARGQFYRVTRRLEVPVYPHEHKLLCVLFNDHGRYQAFARAHDGLEARWVAGYYATLSNRIVFYNDATSPAFEAARGRLQNYEQRMRETRGRAQEADRQRHGDLAKRLHASADDLDRQIRRERDRIGERVAASAAAKTVHEAVHLLAFNSGLQLPDRDYPFWLSEGLASSFETDRPEHAFGPDRPWVGGTRLERFEELRQAGRLARLETLVRLGEVPTWDGDQADAMYSQGFALFSHLYRRDPAAMGRYIQSLSDEPAGRIPADRQVRLFTAAFGDIAEVERALARGLR